jgi:hypothetical protein
MIKSKQVILLIEEITKTSPEEKLKGFVSLLHKVSSGLDLKVFHDTKKVTIVSDMQIVKLSQSSKDFSNIKSTFIKNFVDSFRVVTLNLAKDLGRKEVLGKSLLTYIGVWYPDHSVELSVFGENPPIKRVCGTPLVSVMKSECVRMEFSFPLSLLDSKFAFSTRFIDNLGSRAFSRFVTAASNSRGGNIEAIAPNDIIRLENKILTGVKTASGLKILDFADHLEGYELHLAYNYSVEGKEVNTKFNIQKFCDVVGPKITIPLSGLKTLCNQKAISTVPSDEISQRRSYDFIVPGTSSTIKVNIVAGDNIKDSYSQLFGKLPQYNIRVMCNINRISEWTYIEDKLLDSLIDVISSLFKVYGQLVRGYVDRPAKKTNADW